MRAWNEEINNRVEWIKGILKDAGAKGIVIGMSSGKDRIWQSKQRCIDASQPY